MDSTAESSPRTPPLSKAERAALELGLELERLRAVEAHRAHMLKDLETDLRSPMTAILLELHVLATGSAGPLSPDALRAIDVVRRNVQRWAGLTERLVAQFEDTKEAGRTESVDLAALVAEMVHEFAPRAIKDGVHLHNFAEGDSNLRVEAPLGALRLAVSVLLDQAFSSTPAGGDVTLTTRGQGGRAVLEIQDGGPGYASEELKPLADPKAWKGPEARWTVPLVRTSLLLHSMGGELVVESEGRGMGLCRIVTLPLAQPGLTATPTA